jgi:signal transduction histidine kinase
MKNARNAPAPRRRAPSRSALVGEHDHEILRKEDVATASTAYRRTMTRRAWALDLAVAAVVATLGVLEAFWGVDASHRQGPHWVQATLYVATGLLLVLRRRRPVECLAAIVAVSLVEFAAVGSPEGLSVALPALVGAYSVGRYEDRPRTWWGLGLVLVLWVGWDGLDPMNHTVRMHLDGLFWLSPWVIGWLVGSLVRATANATEQRRLSREQRASRAVAEERNRIARELHDVIGHSVSVMTVQASAVRRRLQPEQAVEREALETVETVGREALREMRRMVGVLRQSGDPSDREPPPGLAQLGALAEKFRVAGLPVVLDEGGERRALAPGLDLTAYRLIQEGLTNALRHAVTPTQVVVSVDYADTAVTIRVRDDGVGLLRPGTEPAHGLLGMRERVSVYGGSLSAGPGPDRGFELVASLPAEAETLADTL